MVNMLKNRYLYNFMIVCFMKYKVLLWFIILYKFDIFWLKLNLNKCYLLKESDIRGFMKKKEYLYFWWFRFINGIIGKEFLKIWLLLLNVNVILVCFICLIGEVKVKFIYCWIIKLYK